MNLLIGCPVKDRGWILDKWFDHVYEACDVAGVSPWFAFMGGVSSDLTDDVIRQKTKTFAIIEKSTSNVDLPPGIHRSWDSSRIESMVVLRNQLLSLVREITPDKFLSLDSDILLCSDAIKNLLETSDEFDAVGGRCYMTAWRRTASYGQIGHEWKRGTDCDSVMPVGVVMAVKMMNSSAYNIDYSFHKDGEDIGWSANCLNAGLSLGWDGRSINKHVLEKDMLNRIDERVGF